jgi:hypothetical protein
MFRLLTSLPLQAANHCVALPARHLCGDLLCCEVGDEHFNRQAIKPSTFLKVNAQSQLCCHAAIWLLLQLCVSVAACRPVSEPDMC